MALQKTKVKQNRARRQGINGRKKGHAFEHSIAKLFRELGWARCCTSRFESKSLDDAKVDLCYTDPFYLQLKAQEGKLCYHDILDSMPNSDKINLVWHKKSRRGTVIAMKQEDFLVLVQQLIQLGAINPAN